MKIQCPHCRHDIEVAVAVVGSAKIDDLPSRYQRSVDILRRDEPPRIAPTIPDPDRPVGR